MFETHSKLIKEYEWDLPCVPTDLYVAGTYTVDDVIFIKHRGEPGDYKTQGDTILAGVFTVIHSVDNGWCNLVDRHLTLQNNQWDDPPGFGWKILKSSGVFLAPTYYRTYNRKVTNVMDVFPRTDVFGVTDVVCKYDVHLNKEDWNNYQFYLHATGDSVGYARQQAAANLYGALGKRTTFNGGVFLAELGESIGLIGKATAAIVSIIRALKKGRVSDAINVIASYNGGASFSTRKRLVNRRKGDGTTKSKYFSDSWLELQFGWLPILGDIYDIMRTHYDLVLDDKVEPEFVHFAGYGREERFYEYVDAFGTRRVRRDTERFSYNYTYRVEDKTWNMLKILGLSNPAAIAWEVVPFSFVIDWFIPVGNWISRFDATIGLEYMGSSLAYKQTMKLENFYSPYISSEGFAFNKTMYSSVETENHVRLPNSDPLAELPPFPFVTKSLWEIVNPWTIVTSLSLIRSLRG